MQTKYLGTGFIKRFSVLSVTLDLVEFVVVQKHPLRLGGVVKTFRWAGIAGSLNSNVALSRA